VFKRCLQRAQKSYSLDVFRRGSACRLQCFANLDQTGYGGDYVAGRPAERNRVLISLHAAEMYDKVILRLMMSAQRR
jgi:hypothetical protein